MDQVIDKEYISFTAASLASPLTVVVGLMPSKIKVALLDQQTETVPMGCWLFHIGHSCLLVTGLMCACRHVLLVPFQCWPHLMGMFCM
jgi:hypothetical protein